MIFSLYVSTTCYISAIQNSYNPNAIPAARASAGRPPYTTALLAPPVNGTGDCVVGAVPFDAGGVEGGEGALVVVGFGAELLIYTLVEVYTELDV